MKYRKSAFGFPRSTEHSGLTVIRLAVSSDEITEVGEIGRKTGERADSSACPQPHSQRTSPPDLLNSLIAVAGMRQCVWCACDSECTMWCVWWAHVSLSLVSPPVFLSSRVEGTG